MLRLIFSLSFLFLGFFSATAQAPKHSYSIYFHWGYNRSYYQKSDLHLKGGDDFDFTLQDVVAKDMPEKYNGDAYFNPTKFTIPQFNFRAGVMIDNKWTISGGWDHLKYVVQGNQNPVINGTIGAVGGQYEGVYSDQTIPLDYEFLRMEHTDGLNFIHLNADRLFKVYEKGMFKAEAVVGVGTGPVCPWTDTRLFNTFYRNPSVHFAGWGFSVNASPRFTFFNRFFIEHLFRVGHIQLWDIMIIRDKYTASQKINYFERNITAGFIFPLKPGKHGNSKSVDNTTN